ncbi:hypothetical protein AVEN_163341-1, partial [Araneus ventricosus]
IWASRTRRMWMPSAAEKGKFLEFAITVNVLEQLDIKTSLAGEDINSLPLDSSISNSKRNIFNLLPPHFTSSC